MSKKARRKEIKEGKLSKKDTVVLAEPVEEAPETPKAEEPAKAAPEAGTSKTEAPKAETPKAETPELDELKALTKELVESQKAFQDDAKKIFDNHEERLKKHDETLSDHERRIKALEDKEKAAKPEPKPEPAPEPEPVPDPEPAPEPVPEPKAKEPEELPIKTADTPETKTGYLALLDNMGRFKTFVDADGVEKPLPYDRIYKAKQASPINDFAVAMFWVKPDGSFGEMLKADEL